MSEDEKRTINDLMDDFADGSSVLDDRRQILEVLEKSADARRQLAMLIVVERLLNITKAKRATVEKIMGALPCADAKKAMALHEVVDEHRQDKKRLRFHKETLGDRQIADSRRKVWNRNKGAYRQDSPVLVFMVIAIMVVLLGGVWWKLDHLEKAVEEDRSVIEQMVTGNADREVAHTVVQSKRLSRSGAARDKKDDQISEKAENITTPEDVAPKGDGSGESGFIPPPAGLKKAAKRDAVESVVNRKDLSGLVMQPLVQTVRKDAPKEPVLIIKLRMGEKLAWDATPNDVGNLLEEFRTVSGLNYIFQERSMAEFDADPGKTPILYISTHYRFSFTPAERDKLRIFMNKGGFVLFDSGGGSEPAYDSACRELAAIFRNVKPQPISSDHPVFRSYFNIEKIKYADTLDASKGKEDFPLFDGVTMNCRTMAIVSRWGLSIGWEGLDRGVYRAYDSMVARKMGINVIAYAIGQRVWCIRSSMGTLDKALRASAGKLCIAQVVYDGEWKTREFGLQTLLQTFNKKTDVPVRLSIKEMRLTEKDIFNAPILYITGHDDFVLNDKEVVQLRKYLEGGGFLFAESCCGRTGFDKAFRVEMDRVLEGRQFVVIPEASVIYSNPNDIGEISVTPALASKLGSMLSKPKLEGIEVDGYYAVVYSQYGLAGAWEMSQNPYVDGYNDVSAIKLGQNILMYAVTH